MKAQSVHTKGATGVCSWSLTQPVLQTRLHTLAAARTENHEEAVLALVEAGATWQSDVRVATYLSQIERLHRTVDLCRAAGM